MKIGGIQPVTLLDYPHKVAAIVFTAGCNFRCPFCYNPNLVVPNLINKARLYEEKALFDLLAKRQKYLEGVVITGGEPTLQPDIIAFCRKIKKLGYAIKLDTNGLLPEVLQELIEKKLVDYIAMDIKGPLDDYGKYAGVKAVKTKIKKSIDLIRGSGLPYEFRSTLVKGLHQGEDIAKMAAAISGADKYFLQNFQSEVPVLDEQAKFGSFSLSEMKKMLDSARELVPNCEMR